MTSPATWLLHRELTTVIERLAVEFPDAGLATIRRTVESATPPARLCDVREISTVVTAVEATARESLLPMTWHAA